jgi:hypothetical protein
MKSRILPIVATIVSLASSASAMSLTIDGSSCGTCDGSDLFLEIKDNSDDTFHVTLILDTSDYDGGKDGVVQVGFGGIQGWTSVDFYSVPAGSWALPIGANVSSSGPCKNGGNTDKICTSGYVAITGGEQKWEFTVTGGTLKTDTADWHIGGQYANLADLRPENELADLLPGNQNGPKGNLISESGPGGSPIPEPNSALLFGIGALAASRGCSRRR